MSQGAWLTQYKHETEDNYTIITSHQIKDKDELKNDLKGWHNGKYRRPVFQTSQGTWNYVPVLCKYLKNCRKGLECFFSHSRQERLYHPLVYKVQQCTNELSTTSDFCLKSEKLCTFYHTEKDRRTSGLQTRPFDLSTYKIFKCRLTLCDQDCVNYHNMAERRRDQNIFSYSQLMCKFVETGDLMSTNLCKNGDNCGFSHTKNEDLYHLMNYKKTVCESFDCRLEYCSFAHLGKDLDRVEGRGKECGDEVNWVDASSAHLDTSSTAKCSEVRLGEERSSDCNSVSPLMCGNGNGEPVGPEEVVESEVSELRDGCPGSEPCQENEMRFDISNYKCQLCRLSEIAFMFNGCGALLCPQCVSKSCPKCQIIHLVIVHF